MLSEKAQALYDALPEDGSMLSGGKLRARVVMSNTEFDAAKQELRASGAVAVGRGRGGTFGRREAGSLSGPPPTPNESDVRVEVEAVVPEPFDQGEEPPKKPTPQERMAIAREAKKAKTTSQQQLIALREEITNRVHKELFPEVGPELINVQFYGGWAGPGLEPYVEVGTAEGADVIRLSRVMEIPPHWVWTL